MHHKSRQTEIITDTKIGPVIFKRKSTSHCSKTPESASTEEADKEELHLFVKTWGEKHPMVVRSWRMNWDELSTFFGYPPEMRQLIYTTNLIMGYNRQLRKVTKGKSVFPNDESLLKMLSLFTMEVTKRWTQRVHN